MYNYDVYYISLYLGRGLDNFKSLLVGAHLLYPDILVAACGTEVYHVGKS